MKEHRSLSMAEARDRLTQIPEDLESLKNEGKPPVIQVTRRNLPVLAVISWEFYESIMETLEVLQDDEQAATLRQALKEIAAGQGKPWSEVKQGLE